VLYQLSYTRTHKQNGRRSGTLCASRIINRSPRLARPNDHG
jgi:hypothetical protein